MKILIFILFFFSCTQPVAKRVAVLTDTDEINLLKTRAYYLEKDSAYQGKQILLLLKNDSIKTAAIKSLSANFTALNKVFKSDSTYQWRAIYSVTPLIPQVASLKIDSAKQWGQIKSATVLIPQVASLKKDSIYQWIQIRNLQSSTAILPKFLLRFTSDSTFQWRAIKKLQATSPVTQIPVMQGQITTLFKTSSTLQKNIDNVIKYVDTISVYVDTTEFSKFGNVIKITALPSILQNIVNLKKDVTELQSNQVPIPMPSAIK